MNLKCAIPFDRCDDAIVALRELVRQYPPKSLDTIVMRPVGADDAGYLAGPKGQAVVYFDLPYVADLARRDMYIAIENKCIELGGRCSWARLIQAPPSEFLKNYPEYDRFVEEAKRELNQPISFRTNLSDRMLCRRDTGRRADRASPLIALAGRPANSPNRQSDDRRISVKTIVHVVGARPNYMKIAPLIDALKAVPDVRQLLVNTGQHYDEAMSKSFLRELALPAPDRDLGVGSGSHAVQTAKVMIGFEEVCLAERPDLVVVVGDVNSTMAATLVAAKLLIPIAHVEAGLRSGDRTMPEEINRLVVTDRLADLLFTPSSDADENLRAEGVPPEKIVLVGNIMIDTLMRHLPIATLDRLRPRLDLKKSARTLC